MNFLIPQASLKIQEQALQSRKQALNHSWSLGFRNGDVEAERDALKYELDPLNMGEPLQIMGLGYNSATLWPSPCHAMENEPGAFH